MNLRHWRNGVKSFLFQSSISSSRKGLNVQTNIRLETKLYNVCNSFRIFVGLLPFAVEEYVLDDVTRGLNVSKTIITIYN